MPSRRLISLLFICSAVTMAAYLLGASLEQISSVLTFLGGVAGVYVFHWQVRIRPRDDQQWAALLFVGSIAFILCLLAWRYFGGPAVGGTPQGVAAFCGAMIALIALAVETREINEGILRDKRKERRQ